MTTWKQNYNNDKHVRHDGPDYCFIPNPSSWLTTDLSKRLTAWLTILIDAMEYCEKVYERNGMISICYILDSKNVHPEEITIDRGELSPWNVNSNIGTQNLENVT